MVQTMEPKNRPTPDHVCAAVAMNALAHPRRMLVFDALVAEPEGLSFGALLERTSLSISTLNHHLKPMKTAHFVATRRKGKEMIYRLNPDALAPYLSRVQADGAAMRERVGGCAN